MKIEQFCARLESSLSLEQAEAILRDYLIDFSIRSYAFTYYSEHIKTGRKLRFHCVSTALRAWHHHYLEQGYADSDRTLEENYHMVLPLFWDTQEQLLKAKNNREKKIRLESIEFGIDKGLSVPIQGNQQEFAILTLHQRVNESCLSNFQVHQFEWMIAGILFYNTVKKLLNLVPVKPDNSLTKRERQCLSLTAKAYRVEKIADILKISPRTVNFHIQNANKKLGAFNKYQAIMKLFSDQQPIDKKGNLS